MINISNLELAVIAFIRETMASDEKKDKPFTAWVLEEDHLTWGFGYDHCVSPLIVRKHIRHVMEKNGSYVELKAQGKEAKTPKQKSKWIIDVNNGVLDALIQVIKIRSGHTFTCESVKCGKAWSWLMLRKEEISCQITCRSATEMVDLINLGDD